MHGGPPVRNPTTTFIYLFSFFFVFFFWFEDLIGRCRWKFMIQNMLQYVRLCLLSVCRALTLASERFEETSRRIALGWGRVRLAGRRRRRRRAPLWKKQGVLAHLVASRCHHVCARDPGSPDGSVSSGFYHQECKKVSLTWISDCLLLIWGWNLNLQGQSVAWQNILCC